jgi:aminoglycoside 3-N-acetyltransferase
MSDFDIQESFHDIGIKRNDIVMIHGDAGVAAQYLEISANRKVDFLIEQIKDYFSEGGTILVPAFSYSFTKNEDFDPRNTKSTVGLFSESFRTSNNVDRTNHPIFSISTWGKLKDDFQNGTILDCFGPNTFFEKLFERDVKLITLGCDFSSLTFVHYVEQKNQVSYRYLKSFSGCVIDSGQKVNVTTEYYVRDLSFKTSCNLGLLCEMAKEKKLMTSGTAGRFPLHAIKASNFFRLAMELLDHDEYSLIDEGVKRSEI